MMLAIVERIENEKNRYTLSKDYKDIFDELDILLFPIVSEKNLEKVSSLCDGLIVTGTANDINPKYYHEEPLEGKNYDIDEFKLDKKAIQLFSDAGKPILGICGGLQSINVYFGGSLNQYIENHALKNELHDIEVKENSFLDKTYNTNIIKVNSLHHQSIKKVAAGFKITAYAPDGTIEAIEKDNIIAVQWHPEMMNDLKFFENFIEIVKERKSNSSK